MKRFSWVVIVGASFVALHGCKKQSVSSAAKGIETPDAGQIGCYRDVEPDSWKCEGSIQAEVGDQKGNFAVAFNTKSYAARVDSLPEDKPFTVMGLEGIRGGGPFNPCHYQIDADVTGTKIRYHISVCKLMVNRNSGEGTFADDYAIQSVSKMKNWMNPEEAVNFRLSGVTRSGPSAAAQNPGMGGQAGTGQTGGEGIDPPATTGPSNFDDTGATRREGIDPPTSESKEE